MVADTETSAFQFTGRWQEFAPIAITNLLLTIITLGFYRFWATTRERRYLWSHSEFIGTPLEWTGTGMELFIGAMFALLLLGIPLLILQFGLQAMMLQGYAAAAGITVFILYFALLYLVGVARFRALRYRLSRTFWRGIRGGSDENGLGYGWSYLWMTMVGGIALGLMIPWSMVNLWNERWNRMSFGSQEISSTSQQGPIMGRFLLFYLVPLAAVVCGVLLAFTAGRVDPNNPVDGASGIVALIIGLGILVVYILLPLIALAFYAAFFRNAVGHMQWAGLEFRFEARTTDWLLLFLGSLGLVIVTLGFGALFLQYRNWSFFMRHLHAYGEIDLAALEQSTTTVATQGEGLLDAFDIGAL